MRPSQYDHPSEPVHSKMALSNPIRPALARLRRSSLWTRSSYVRLYLWRSLMFRTRVIAITGSVGKTTAKEALTRILSRRGPTLSTYLNENDELGVPNTLKRLRPWHRFAVIEIGTSGPGTIKRLARLVRPDVAVVLCVARAHTNVFKDLDATAGEKASLLRALKPWGTAVLNADDDRVRGMADRGQSKTLTFGGGDRADVQRVRVEGAWPERLTITFRAQGEEHRVRTHLVGSHWANSVLGALGAALACGVPLSDAVRSLERMPPAHARLQPVRLPSGAVVLRDDGSGGPDALEAMLAVLREARAARRVLVFSDLSDSREKPRKRLRELGRFAAQWTDLALFVGDHAHHARTAAVAAGMAPAACHDMVNLEHAAALLRRELRPGDLVFLKGRATDHLTRLMLAQFGDIGCWTVACSRRRPCDVCPKLSATFDVSRTLSAAAVSPGAARWAGSSPREDGAPRRGASLSVGKKSIDAEPILEPSTTSRPPPTD